MRRNAFTLVELIISIFLLGIIVTLLYNAVDNLQKSNILLNKKVTEFSSNERLLTLLYDDIFTAHDLNITGQTMSTISMQTTNSLFEIESPYVTWVVSKKEDTLLRFESILPFTQMTADNNHLYHISKVGENCEHFHFYQSKDKNTLLMYIQFKENEPIIYSFFKPLQKETNSTSAQN